MLLMDSKWHPVKIFWIPEGEGGRKCPPSAKEYYCVSKFPNDSTIGGKWSVKFILNKTDDESKNSFSRGVCRFLSEEAPEDNFKIFDQFDIYEGPKKVGKVDINRS